MGNRHLLCYALIKRKNGVYYGTQSNPIMPAGSSAVLLLIILLVGCKWSVGRAAVVSVAVDAVIALSAFGAHPLQILVSAAKGAWSSLSIILIICPAILMYNIVREAGAFQCHSCGDSAGHPQ